MATSPQYTLNELAEAYASLKARNILIECVTAEPGDVKARLEAKRGGPLPFEVKSDPDHLLLSKEAGDVFVKVEGQKSKGGVYTMVQPALIVFENGKVVKECTWSWKILGLAGPLTEMTDAPTGNAYPPYYCKLVAFRPSTADVGDAVEGKRRPKCSMVGNIDFPLNVALPVLGTCASCNIA
ncbi:hypothetical protein M885DRAFT_574774 [Pelagophyceae sp. CCMP2097]|nr:hypothetical protein M885DRAFT_574774 [Pelagophyceae sp. CCMP2097]